MGAFKWKVLKVHYLTLVWKRSLQNFEAEYSDLLQFGWKSNLDISGHFPLIAVVTEELPVPEATLELTYCGCKQTKYSTNRCGCHNIDTALCGCLECSNSNGPTITMIDHDILVLIRL